MLLKEEVKQLKFLTHRNQLSIPIFRILADYFKNYKEGRSGSPSWLPIILPLSSDETSAAFSSTTSPLFLLPQYPPLPRPLRHPRHNSHQRFANPYYTLDPTRSLLQALRSRAFLEYPTIEIVAQDDAGDILYADDYLSSGDDGQDGEPSSKRKKRRIESQKTHAMQGERGLVGLLAGYSSDKDENGDTEGDCQGDQGGAEKDKGVLGLLGYNSDVDASSDQHRDSREEDGDDNHVIVRKEGVELVASIGSIPGQTPPLANRLVDSQEDDELDWGEDEYNSE